MGCARRGRIVTEAWDILATAVSCTLESGQSDAETIRELEEARKQLADAERRARIEVEAALEHVLRP